MVASRVVVAAQEQALERVPEARMPKEPEAVTRGADKAIRVRRKRTLPSVLAAINPPIQRSHNRVRYRKTNLSNECRPLRKTHRRPRCFEYNDSKPLPRPLTTLRKKAEAVAEAAAACKQSAALKSKERSR